MHETVLLNEAVKALITKPSGNYIDGTFGRGGHSKAILKKLSAEGSLLAVDRDPEAIICASKIAEKDSRLKVYKGLFSELSLTTQAAFQVEVDGILLDLGVSSPQLDSAERGFSSYGSEGRDRSSRAYGPASGDDGFVQSRTCS